MDIVTSYRIQKLQEALILNPDAANLFIEELKVKGTPIIEEVEGYNRFLWVTHVYITTDDIDNIAVSERHISFNYERAEFTHIKGTPIWYKTTIVPYDFNVHYAFSINDTLEENWHGRNKNLVLDPLNKKSTIAIEGRHYSTVKTPSKSK